MKNIQDWMQVKKQSHALSMITCYDYPSALLVEQSDIDCVLVGDSVAMVIHGHKDTIQATVPMMAAHTAAVAKGLKSKWLVSDLPFMSYRKSLSEAMDAAELMIRKGAHSIKLEGAMGNELLIKHMVQSGIPVMGHLGLMPQHHHVLGGFKVQGKTVQAGESLLEQAKLLEACGCYAVVLECIPEDLASKITDVLSIPTIGIGAGSRTDGQVLVWHDVLGLLPGFKARFVKQFAQGAPSMLAAVNAFVAQVKCGTFPEKKHTYQGV